MPISQKFPDLLPILLLDFANSGTLDPRITFSRSSTATFYGSNKLIQTAAAGAARFDHDPVTGDKLGLLIEEQRVNFLQYSAALTTSPWTNANCNSTGGHLAPDGTTTATLYTCNGTVPTLFYQVLTTSTTGTGILTSSVYAKAATSTTFTFNTYYVGDTEINITFTLTGAGSTSDAVNSTITAVGNSGWYRCTINTPARVNAGTDVAWRIWPTTRPTATAGLGCYFWGAQLEAGAFATSYIPTVASQVTRSSDDASMTGTNFSSWYNQSAGTYFSASQSLYGTHPVGSRAGIFYSSAGSSSNYISFAKSSGGSSYAIIIDSSSSSQVSMIAITSSVANQQVNIAGAYELNNFAGSGDGSISTDNSIIPPVVDRILIGRGIDGGWYYNGTIKKIAYYPRRLTNTQLQELTS